MQPNKNDRSGDEHYTPEKVVIDYLLPFALGKRVYTPFGQNSTVKRILSKYTTVIDTPIKYNCDFFSAMQDDKFVAYLKQHKFIIVDNPPFSKQSKILDCLLKCGIDFFLLGSTLTALTPSKGKIMYKNLGHVKYESGKTVCTCLYSNTFNCIQMFPARKQKNPIVRKKNRGYITSGDVDTLTKKGMVIYKDDIISYTGKLFGGAILLK